MGDFSAMVVKINESAFNGSKLFAIKDKLASDSFSQFHKSIISKILINLNIKNEANRSSLLLKQRASAI